jgi:hypothetical protein
MAAFERAESLAATSGNQLARVAALDFLAKFDLYNGAPARARQRLDDAVELVRGFDQPVREINLVASQMVVLRVLGEHDEVEACAERGFELARRTGSRADDVLFSTYLCASRVLRRELAGAREAARRARESWNQCGRNLQRSIGYLEHWEAEGWLAEGDLGAADVCARSAIDRFRRLPDAPNERRTLSLRAKIAAEIGEDARAAADAVVEVMRVEDSWAWDLPVALARRARVRWLAGDRDGAAADVAEAEALGRAGTYDRPGGDLAVELATLRSLDQ